MSFEKVLRRLTGRPTAPDPSPAVAAVDDIAETSLTAAPDPSPAAAVDDIAEEDAPAPLPADAEPAPPVVDDELEASPPLECTEREVQRWNDEWLAYLKTEWPWQLAPYTQYPDTPPLPDSPLALLKLAFDFGWDWKIPLSLYCDREALEGKRVMEVGCGCGNMGKL
ncbi:MAG TPA: hypothetical protein VL025_06085, partial [Thermoanaerobaculia bacterium]|nr:hypothetical protein [Thermoanaerobaculia bacterium]